MFFRKKKEQITDDDIATIDALNRAGDSIQFPRDVRLRARARLFQMVDALKQNNYKNNYKKENTTMVQYGKASLYRLRTSAVVFTLIILLGISSGAGIVSADSSRPGDALFGIDKLLEEVQLFLTTNPEAKLKLKIAIAAERLQELHELTVALENETNGTNGSGTNATSTDPGTATSTPSTATSTSTPNTATSTPDSSTTTDDAATTTDDTATSTDDIAGSSSALADAIAQAVAEVEGAIAKVKDGAAKLTLKADHGETITPEQRDAFLGQISALVAREDLLIQKLKLNVTQKKIELKLKTFEPKAEHHGKGDKYSDDDKHTDNEDTETTTHSTSTVSTVSDEENDIDSKDSTDDRDGEISIDDTVSTSTQLYDNDEKDNHDEDKDDRDSDKKHSNKSGDESGKEKKESDTHKKDEDHNDNHMTVKGVIENVSTSTIGLLGYTISITDDTEFNGKEHDGDMLTVGRWAQIKAVIQRNGSVIAEKIKVK